MEWVVKCWDSQWLQKGYINGHSEMMFPSAVEAILYGEIMRSKGIYTQLDYRTRDSNVKSLKSSYFDKYGYPLPVDHSYKVIVKWNTTNYGRW